MSAASTREQHPLTQDEKVAAFRAATSVFVRKYAERFAAGMTDATLEAALRDSLGIFGGRGGPGQLHVTWRGAGLKIWVSWHVHNHVQEKPIFEGARTLAIAREVYGICDPENSQLSLF